MDQIVEQSWQLLDGLNVGTESFPLEAEVGEEEVLIFRVGDGFRAVQKLCPHQNLPMTEGQVVANGTMLRCVLHGYTFRLKDGKGMNCPGRKIKVYDVKQDGASLYVREST